MEPVGQWSGLRPGSPEGVPYIGEIVELPGLWVNAGHYRNGLVLAPASCRLLADLMIGRRPGPAWNSFVSTAFRATCVNWRTCWSGHSFSPKVTSSMPPTYC